MIDFSRQNLTSTDVRFSQLKWGQPLHVGGLFVTGEHFFNVYLKFNIFPPLNFFSVILRGNLMIYHRFTAVPADTRRWSTVYDAGPTLNQRWIIFSCFCCFVNCVDIGLSVNQEKMLQTRDIETLLNATL